MRRKTLLILTLCIGMLCAGCGKAEEEVVQEPIKNEMLTDKIDAVQTVLSGRNIKILGELEDAASIELETILSDNINYPEIEYKIPEKTEIVKVFNVTVKDIEKIPMTFKNDVEITIDVTGQLEDVAYQFFKVGKGFELTELEFEIVNEQIVFNDNDFGFFVLTKESTQIEEEIIEEETENTEETETTEVTDELELPLEVEEAPETEETIIEEEPTIIWEDELDFTLSENEVVEE